VAEKAIRDQEDQLRRLLNPGEEDLRQDVRLTPVDPPVTVLEPLSLQEAIDTAIEQRPEITQAKKNVETGELNKQFARNQLLPTLSLQGTVGLAGLGGDYSESFTRNFYSTNKFFQQFLCSGVKGDKRNSRHGYLQMENTILIMICQLRRQESLGVPLKIF
jgi:outer membrane protein TolC